MLEGSVAKDNLRICVVREPSSRSMHSKVGDRSVWSEVENVEQGLESLQYL